MQLIFMGTPDFAVPALEALIAAGHRISCAYSQPPRAAGRGMEARKSPVHLAAEAHGIEVRTPINFKTESDIVAFRALKADAAVVVAYGLLLPKPILDGTKHGCFNIHASLLPRWRGAAPIQRAIMAGDAETGVCIMKMDEGLDTGPVCARGIVPISMTATAGTLHDELSALGAKLMEEVLRKDRFECAPQAAEGVTYARKITKAEARIDFNKSSNEVRYHIHGLSPFPGAWFEASGQRIKILTCEITESEGTPGTVFDEHLTIACAKGAIRPLLLQREGKAAMPLDAFLRGFALPAGTRLA
ncbi:MAG: methionyl-tRNA formyltransferase [Aestuariivirga sp.]